MILRICLILFIMITGAEAQNFGETLVQSKLFGCHYEETSNSTLEEFLVTRVDSISKAETVKGTCSQLRISCQCAFEKLPCIRYYFLEDLQWPIDDNLLPYHEVFFNSCDSTFYPSNGDSQRFSRLIKSCLLEIVKGGEEQVLDICLLFLYTASRIPLQSVDDYREIWDEDMKSTPDDTKELLQLTDEFIKSDIETVKNTIHPKEMFKPVEIFKEEGYYRVLISAWRPYYGDIESWMFDISPNVFEVSGKFRDLEKMGPYVRRIKDFHE